jgi:hypothetical protein
MATKLPRQLFSAKTGGEVADFARATLRDPVRVEIARSGTMAERAEQQVFLAGQHEKLGSCSPSSSPTTSRRSCSRARSVVRIG